MILLLCCCCYSVPFDGLLSTKERIKIVLLFVVVCCLDVGDGVVIRTAGVDYCGDHECPEAEPICAIKDGYLMCQDLESANSTVVDVEQRFDAEPVRVCRMEVWQMRAFWFSLPLRRHFYFDKESAGRLLRVEEKDFTIYLRFAGTDRETFHSTTHSPSSSSTVPSLSSRFSSTQVHSTLQTHTSTEKAQTSSPTTHRHTSTQTYRPTDTQTQTYTSTQAPTSNQQTHRHTDTTQTHSHRHTFSQQTHRHTETQTHFYRSTQQTHSHRHTPTPQPHRSTTLSSQTQTQTHKHTTHVYTTIPHTHTSQSYTNTDTPQSSKHTHTFTASTQQTITDKASTSLRPVSISTTIFPSEKSKLKWWYVLIGALVLAVIFFILCLFCKKRKNRVIYTSLEALEMGTVNRAVQDPLAP